MEMRKRKMFRVVKPEPQTIDDPLLSNQEAAAYCDLSVRKLYSARMAGEVKYVKISQRCIKFRKSDLDSYIASKLVSH